MGINELYVGHDTIWRYLAVSGSCGNSRERYHVDIVFCTFGSPTVIGFLNVICSRVSVGLM